MSKINLTTDQFGEDKTVARIYWIFGMNGVEKYFLCVYRSNIKCMYTQKMVAENVTVENQACQEAN
jgi:hypothetical protein